MEKTDYKTYFKFLSLTLMAILFVLGLGMASGAIASLIDLGEVNAGINVMIFISGLAILGSVGTYIANKFKPSKTLEIAGFIVDAAVLVILFILGIVIVVVSGLVTPGVNNWIALILLSIVFAFNDVTSVKSLSKELKGLQEASAAAAAAASIAEAESLKEKEKPAEEGKEETKKETKKASTNKAKNKEKVEEAIIPEVVDEK